jgi:hypothetical protein
VNAVAIPRERSASIVAHAGEPIDDDFRVRLRGLNWLDECDFPEQQPQVGWVQLRRLILLSRAVPDPECTSKPEGHALEKYFAALLNPSLVCSTYRAAKESGLERQPWSARLRLCAGPPSRERVEPVCACPAIGSSVPV